MKIAYSLALAAWLAAPVAQAQVATKPPASEATKPDPPKDAFLGFPEADRKAAQGALVWLGLYNGVTDGAFGKRTLESIEAYQKKAGAKPDGVLTPALLAELAKAEEKPRAAVGFASFDDPSTGMRISAPMKLLDKRTLAKGHTLLASKDGAITLDLRAPASGPTLDATFHLLSAVIDGRKVDYKAMKPDAFFVVSGEEGDSKFYLRYAQGPDGALRGFEFRYPKARAETLDRIVIAVANAFEPFPTAAPVELAPTPVASPARSGPWLVATAFVIAPGQALTALAPAECAKPFVAGAPATFGRVDPASGLARLDGDFGAGASPARLAEEAADPILLSRAPGAAADESLLEASRGDWTLTGDRASLVVSAASSARGAPVFNDRGDLLGLLAPTTKPLRKIGGVTIAEPRLAIAGAAVKAFLAEAPDGGGEAMTAPELARKLGPRALAVTCAS